MSAQNDAIRRQMSFGIGEPRSLADMQFQIRKVEPEPDPVEDGVYYANPGETVHGVKNITHRKLAITVISGQVVSVTAAD